MTRLPIRKYPPNKYFIDDGKLLIAVIRDGKTWRVLYKNKIIPGLTWLEAWRLVKNAFWTRDIIAEWNYSMREDQINVSPEVGEK